MAYLLIIVLLLILVFGPQFWVRRVLDRHNRVEEANFPGS